MNKIFQESHTYCAAAPGKDTAACFKKVLVEGKKTGSGLEMMWLLWKATSIIQLTWILFFFSSNGAPPLTPLDPWSAVKSWHFELARRAGPVPLTATINLEGLWLAEKDLRPEEVPAGSCSPSLSSQTKAVCFLMETFHNHINTAINTVRLFKYFKLSVAVFLEIEIELRTRERWKDFTDCRTGFSFRSLKDVNVRNLKISSCNLTNYVFKVSKGWV